MNTENTVVGRGVFLKRSRPNGDLNETSEPASKICRSNFSSVDNLLVADIRKIICRYLDDSSHLRLGRTCLENLAELRQAIIEGERFSSFRPVNCYVMYYIFFPVIQLKLDDTDDIRVKNPFLKQEIGELVKRLSFNNEVPEEKNGKRQKKFNENGWNTIVKLQSRFPNVNEISCAPNSANNLADFNRFEKLQSLDLSYCTSISRLPFIHTGVVKLNLSHSSINYFQFEEWKNLTSLSIKGCSFMSLNPYNFSNIQRLDISETELISPPGIFPSVKWVDLRGTKTSFCDTDTLEPPFPNLKELNLKDSEIHYSLYSSYLESDICLIMPDGKGINDKMFSPF